MNNNLRILNVRTDPDVRRPAIDAAYRAGQLYRDAYNLQRDRHAPPLSDEEDVFDAAAIRRAAAFVTHQTHHPAVLDLLNVVSPVLYMALGRDVVRWDQSLPRVWLPGLPDDLDIQTDTGERREDEETWESSSGLVAVRFAQMSRFRREDHLVVGIYHMSEAELKAVMPRG